MRARSVEQKGQGAGFRCVSSEPKEYVNGSAEGEFQPKGLNTSASDF